MKSLGFIFYFCGLIPLVFRFAGGFRSRSSHHPHGVSRRGAAEAGGSDRPEGAERGRLDARAGGTDAAYGKKAETLLLLYTFCDNLFFFGGDIIRVREPNQKYGVFFLFARNDCVGVLAHILWFEELTWIAAAYGSVLVDCASGNPKRVQHGTVLADW